MESIFFGKIDDVSSFVYNIKNKEWKVVDPIGGGFEEPLVDALGS
ncbi:hypothetical protein [Acetobacter sp. DmW_043]|nr:hypothetical protein [Acetobacter sp. DmW_043]